MVIFPQSVNITIVANRPFLAFPSGEGGCFGTKQTDEEKNVNFYLYVTFLRLRLACIYIPIFFAKKID